MHAVHCAYLQASACSRTHRCVHIFSQRGCAASLRRSPPCSQSWGLPPPPKRAVVGEVAAL
eukprot:3566887-Lingulodinium_polyedra.AAC.1